MTRRRSAIRIRLEIPSYHRERQARGWVVVSRRARVAGLDLAIVRAAVVIEHVAVVALLATSRQDPVTTHGLARANRARGSTALGLGGTRRRATVEGHRVAVVARFAGLQLAVATDGFLASAAATVEARLDLASRRAAVLARRVAVVASFEALHDAVAAQRGAGLTRDAADVAGLDALAVARATIAAHGVAVVAPFVRRQDAVPAHSKVLAGLARGTADPVRLELADATAAVAVDLIGVVASLAALEGAVPAGAAARIVGAREPCVHQKRPGAARAARARCAAARCGLSGAA